jgi:hypothetical protein
MVLAFVSGVEALVRISWARDPLVRKIKRPKGKKLLRRWIESGKPTLITYLQHVRQ